MNLDMEADVRLAMDEGQLRLHYQPIVSLDSGRVRGLEALLRWEHPQGGLLLPDDFLPSVVHTHVMPRLTAWVLETACRDAGDWPGMGISVNVSAGDVSDRQLLASVEVALSSSGLPPDRLTIELTEQTVIQDLAVAVDLLRVLRSLGVHLSLDDFGTGYSSLFYLRKMPITELKIDRVFIHGVGENDEDGAIVRSVVRLAHGIGVTVVAEGVERAEQVTFLRATGCGAAQGFLWGQPRPATTVDPRRLIRLPHVVPGPAEAPTPPTPHTEATLAPAPDPATARMEELLQLGASLHTIAAALNREGIRTPNGTRWSSASVAVTVAALLDET